ncbi:MAG: hypothetical protein ACREBV_08090, partial [Candidatus Zixiibacteriota bacterium]
MSPDLCDYLAPFCRLKKGEIWNDPVGAHRVGCGDAADESFVRKIHADITNPKLAVHDPPYNLVFGEKLPVEKFVDWCNNWVRLT